MDGHPDAREDEGDSHQEGAANGVKGVAAGGPV